MSGGLIIQNNNNKGKIINIVVAYVGPIYVRRAMSAHIQAESEAPAEHKVIIV